MSDNRILMEMVGRVTLVERRLEELEQQVAGLMSEVSIEAAA